MKERTRLLDEAIADLTSRGRRVETREGMQAALLHDGRREVVTVDEAGDTHTTRLYKLERTDPADPGRQPAPAEPP